MSAKRRRSKGDGGVYRRSSDGLWVANLDLGYVPDPDNPPYRKRVRKLAYAKTKTDALRKLRKLQAEYAQYGTVPTGSHTVEQWLTYWLDELVQVKPRTLATYRSHVEQHIIPALGRKRLDKLQPADVRALHRYVISKGLSSTTALHAHRILSTALQAAMREQVIVRNVATLVKAPSRVPPGRQGLTADQARAVLRVARDGRLYSRWLFALLTGARQGETLGLRWEYVDLGAGTVDLAWSLQRVPYEHGCGQDKPSHQANRCPSRRLEIPDRYEHEILDGNLTLMRPKTKGSVRLVPLAEPLRRALEARKLAVDVERDQYARDHDLVWCRPDGRPIDGRQDWRAWKSLLEAAGAPDVSIHESRHTTASLLHELGVSDKIAAQILGHSDVLVTRAYQREDITFARDAVARLGDALSLD